MKLLQKLPRTVEEAYEKILMNVKDSDLARKTLHIVVAATRPLTIHEMNIAFVIEEKIVSGESFQSHDDLDLESEKPFRKKIRNICDLFVSVIDSKVYLIHQTTKEFLISKIDSSMLTGLDKSFSKNWMYSLSPAESNYILVKICLTYILLSDSKSSKTITAANSFLSYAAEFWPTHFQNAKLKSDSSMLELALSVCDTRSKKFRRWFRVYSRDKHFDYNNHPDTNSLIFASYLGLEALLKLLLDKKEVELNCKNIRDRTPLSRAAAEGHIKAVKQLLEKDDVDINSKDNYGWTPLSWALRKS